MNNISKPNIFLITVDALRADHIYNKETKIHPFLSSLMKKSIVFKRAFSPAHATRMSFKSMFSELDPLEENPDFGIEKKHSIPKDVKYITDEFKDNGYTTAGFTSNSFLTRIQGYDRGFDYFYDGLSNDDDENNNVMKKISLSALNDILPFKLNHENELYRKIKATFDDDIGYSTDVVKKAIDFLNSHSKDRPFFVWIHLMDVHSPYRLSPEWFKKIDEKYIPRWEMEKLRQKRQKFDRISEGINAKELDKIKTLYKAAIRKIDNDINILYDYLKKNGFLNNGKIVLTSDHGEFLGDWDLTTHQSYLYNSVLHVPLIIYDDTQKNQKKEINKVFGNINLLSLISSLNEKGSIEKSIDEYLGFAISATKRNGDELYSIQNTNFKIIYNQKKKKRRIFKKYKGNIKYNNKVRNLNYLNNKIMNYLDKKNYIEKIKIKKVINLKSI